MKTRFYMKRIALTGVIILLLLALLPILQSSKAQLKDSGRDPIVSNRDSISNQPRVDIHVKKQKDQNGNIIGYDSTYTSTWSNNGEMPENIDSIFRSMQKHFSGNFSFNMSPFGFKSPALKDSSMDSFNGMFDDNWADMHKMIEQQRKMMEEFFNQQPILKVPDGVGKPAPKQKEESPKPKEQENPKEEKAVKKSDTKTIDL
jgi:hypothetical protein